MAENTKATPFGQPEVETSDQNLEVSEQGTERLKRPNLLRAMSFEWFGFKGKAKSLKSENTQDSLKDDEKAKIKPEADSVAQEVTAIEAGPDGAVTSAVLGEEVPCEETNEEPKIRPDSHVIRKITVSLAFVALCAGCIAKALAASA